MRSLGTISLLLFLTFAGAASAASQQDWGDCKQFSDRDRQIAGCTRVLQDQAESAGNRALAHRNRGVAYDMIGATDRAVADFDQAIKLDPKFAPAHLSRGFMYAKKGEHGRAIASYTEALRLDGKYAVAYSQRANTYHQLKDYDRAIADYNEAIKLDPKVASLYTNRGNSFYAKKNYDRAIADYSEAIKLDPKSAFRYTSRAGMYAERKDYDRAIADYSEAIKLLPKDAVLYNNRGNMHLAKKDYDRAIADYSEAIKLDPKLAFAYHSRGVAYHWKNNYDRAIVDYSEAIKLDPDNTEYRRDRDNAQEAKRAAATPEKPREPQHWLANNTPVAFDVIYDGKTVCSLAPGKDCWWPAGSGQHVIELRRQDGKTMRKALSISGFGGVLHQLICPLDVSRRSNLPRDACN